MGQNYSKQSNNGKSDVNFKEQPFGMSLIPVECIIFVLSKVPVSDIKNCRLVCRIWQQLIDGHSVWKEKCLHENIFFPSREVLNINEYPTNFFRSIYLKKPFNRNLLKNSTGEENLSQWTVIENGGDKWLVEKEAVGVDPFPEDGIKTCFSTSYMNCSKSQLIDLSREGVPQEVMDNARPKIEVSEWYAARFDCGSTYELTVRLLDKNYEPQDEFHYGPQEVAQWQGRQWIQTKHLFEHYPPGVRYIQFRHSGKDTQFWAGHYGSKMCGAKVTFVFNK
ncbi:F-box only protein 44-like [Limulus polyphemus]|uniref:F-box only protein 44-like n=1 Tax=Limulus polyphemus TaxID=6850 RepID=A0ABM1BZC3_LIMPO|nr:F-box only protein 44-like [Limulus polyphemus]